MRFIITKQEIGKLLQFGEIQSLIEINGNEFDISVILEKD